MRRRCSRFDNMSAAAEPQAEQKLRLFGFGRLDTGYVSPHSSQIEKLGEPATASMSCAAIAPNVEQTGPVVNVTAHRPSRQFK